jgi:hypothetical protein
VVEQGDGLAIVRPQTRPPRLRQVHPVLQRAPAVLVEALRLEMHERQQAAANPDRKVSPLSPARQADSGAPGVQPARIG